MPQLRVILEEHVAADNVRTKVMKSHINVLGAWPRLVDCCDLDRATVVLEGATMNLWVCRLAIEAMLLPFPDESHKGMTSWRAC